MLNITPYLKALKAFETTARHQSFSMAAKELDVTSAAVGQLVKQLEDQLSVTLFQRNQGGANRLLLTEKAKLALPDIQTGMAYLEKGVSHLLNCVENSQLAVSVSSALASQWLLARLEHFQAQYPEISVQLHTDIRALDFSEQNIDVAIRYGLGDWKGLKVEKLFDEACFPVCSPEFLQKNVIFTPLDLSNLPLIDDVQMNENLGFHSWQFWLKQNGITASSAPRVRAHNSSEALKLAMEGQGVALLQENFAQEMLNQDRLIRLFPETQLATSFAYYLVFRAECAELDKVKKFRNWLLG